jgi:hypothetical protein
MLARTTALCVVLVAGCASTSRTVQNDDLAGSARSPGLYIGHSTNGDVVVAASHYDAMAGLATTSDELGLPARKGSGNEEMKCQREVLTGTHVPQWICRYDKDMRLTREATVDFLQQNHYSVPGKANTSGVLLGSGPGGGHGGTVAP